MTTCIRQFEGHILTSSRCGSVLNLDVQCGIFLSGNNRRNIFQNFEKKNTEGLRFINGCLNRLSKISRRVCVLFQDVGFTADPIDDNIYQWCVKLFDFEVTR